VIPSLFSRRRRIEDDRDTSTPSFVGLMKKVPLKVRGKRKVEQNNGPIAG